MIAESDTVCVDRATGSLREDPVYAGGFLRWAYSTGTGRLLTGAVLSQPVLSRLYGWYCRRRRSIRKIAPFAARMKVDMTESLRPLDQFTSFNDFFTREIDLGRRPLCTDPLVCVCPVDGRIAVVPVLDPDRPFQVKHVIFDLRKFLSDDSLVRMFVGGAMALCRLYLPDYHHVHFPDSGRPWVPRTIRGKLHASGPYARRRPMPPPSVNHRMITLLDSDHFGTFGITEVGAMTVGSIRQVFIPGTRVHKGERKAVFELGGSTVVLLFPPGAIRFDEDLITNSEHGVSTYVRMGESLGRAC